MSHSPFSAALDQAGEVWMDYLITIGEPGEPPLVRVAINAEDAEVATDRVMASLHGHEDDRFTIQVDAFEMLPPMADISAQPKPHEVPWDYDFRDAIVPIWLPRIGNTK